MRLLIGSLAYVLSLFFVLRALYDTRFMCHRASWCIVCIVCIGAVDLKADNLLQV